MISGGPRQKLGAFGHWATGRFQHCMYVHALLILIAKVAWKFDMIPTFRPPPSPPPLPALHQSPSAIPAYLELTLYQKYHQTQGVPDDIYAYIIHGILSMISNSKTTFGMERVCIHEPTMLCSIILDNLWDAENADLSLCEHQISKLN